jgi:serine protease AprX
MRIRWLGISFIVGCGLLAAKLPPATGGTRPVFSQAVQQFLQTGEDATLKVWIFFLDHGNSPGDVSSAISAVALGERAMTRRLNRSRGPLVDVHDLPVPQRYIDRVRATGCSVRKTSKYFNALSAVATREQIEAIGALPFVGKIDRVAVSRRAPEPDVEHMQQEMPRSTDAGGSPAADPLYGPSFKQLDVINVPPLHESGDHGEGVLVAMLDTGFNRGHVSLKDLDVIAEYDFVNNDGVTENQPGDPSNQDYHGTYTLSALAGYAPGDLIGPAWAASFILAKTERVNTEIIDEEDDWVRGVEWAESLGAEVVSSSLGYFTWYTYEDLDGNTAITTRAADIAASKGVTVVTAAGNEGPLPWPGIIAPSDGDSVIAVGAVDSFGVVVSFSSRGPSFDGRIKPDVMGQGLAVVSAAPWDSLGFTRVSGTSLSTPLVAGACALLLKMHPYWTPIDVLNALRSSASKSTAPDNDYGWGIINAYVAALNGSTGIAGALFEHEVLNGAVILTIYTPNAQSTGFDLLRRKRLSADGEAWTPFTMLVDDFKADSIEPFVYTDTPGGGGIYRYRIQSHSNPAEYMDMSSDVAIPWRFALHQNYPNPFSPSVSRTTEFRFELGGYPTADAEPPLSAYHTVLLDIYDVTGARVRSLFDGLRAPGEYIIPWDGTDDRNTRVASGVYYYRLRVDNASLTRKIVVLNP